MKRKAPAFGLPAQKASTVPLFPDAAVGTVPEQLRFDGRACKYHNTFSNLSL